MLCAEPKEHKHFRLGTRPGGSRYPAGRIGDRGDREIVYVPNVYVPCPAHLDECMGEAKCGSPNGMTWTALLWALCMEGPTVLLATSCKPHLRAAWLQNETAPKSFNFKTKNGPKNDPKLPRNILSLSGTILKYFTANSRTKSNIFSRRESAGMATLTHREGFRLVEAHWEVNMPEVPLTEIGERGPLEKGLALKDLLHLEMVEILESLLNQTVKKQGGSLFPIQKPSKEEQCVELPMLSRIPPHDSLKTCF